jgi:S-adenosylmethionine:tRNA ribosyltransferase-isomerase
MKLSDYDFNLPQELIAQIPSARRDQSRLMVVERASESITHDVFSNICQYLPNHPLMIFNDTRVIPAKLSGIRKDNGNNIDIILIRETEPGIWEALMKGLGRMKGGTEFSLCDGAITAVLQGRADNRALLKLIYQGELGPILKQSAQMPLPPYIRRNDDDNPEITTMDRERYQTVYAANEGAIAAPTAGLHFTPELLDKIASGKADLAFLTLHVGVGTFMPIRVQDIPDHKMGWENYLIQKETWNKLVVSKNQGQKILAVGTTATRVLESLNFENQVQKDVTGGTEIFIYPGRKFNTVNHLLTNFHLPKSTLYLLVCAFSGDNLMQKAYQEAIDEKYRFFSYGDAMLIL